jgi:hypothetical protein
VNDHQNKVGISDQNIRLVEPQHADLGHRDPLELEAQQPLWLLHQ